MNTSGIHLTGPGLHQPLDLTSPLPSVGQDNHAALPLAEAPPWQHNLLHHNKHCRQGQNRREASSPFWMLKTEGEVPVGLAPLRPHLAIFSLCPPMAVLYVSMS